MSSLLTLDFPICVFGSKKKSPIKSLHSGPVNLSCKTPPSDMRISRMRSPVQLLILVLLCSSLMESSLPLSLSKLGCQDKCGNVSISYPFGMGSPECYYDERFLITCNISSSPPKAFLGTNKSNVDLVEILINDGQLRTTVWVSRDCYTRNGTRTGESFSTSLDLSPWNFTISNTKNKFTVIGCDTLGTVQGYKSSSTEEYWAGCMSFCNNATAKEFNGSCDGLGCCQTSIPKGLAYVNVNLETYYNHTQVWELNNCSYATIVEQNNFTSSPTYLKNFPFDAVPVVIDWSIGINQTCEMAKRNRSSYACKAEHTTCNDQLENISGYRCTCLKGYEGNPYLHGGCKDIDQCADPKLHDCINEGHCNNTMGSYTCFCPSGYKGDGRKDGERCTAIPAKQFPTIQVIVGIGASIVFLFVVGLLAYVAFKKITLKKLRKKFFEQNGGGMLKRQLTSLRDKSSSVAFKIYTAQELKKATNNYEKSRMVGQGGYGIVYKGFLASEDNKIVAVKKSKTVDRTQIEQFINELIVLTQINHRNVVKLLGCCLETEAPLLIYEFVSNGTLFDHIYNKRNAAPTISWEYRLKIAADVAGVLSYLHSAASTPIIHRDIKSTNILLDSDYNAKVSDFGASRLIPVDRDQLTTLVQGTPGYLDPEYLQTSQLTEKSDVYSFGVVLVELLTGEKAFSSQRPEKERSLVMVFLTSLKENLLFQLLDNRIVNEGNVEQLKEVAELAKRCLREKGRDRPSMKDVAMELERQKMTVKHIWIKGGLNSGEPEYVHCERLETRMHGNSSNSGAAFISQEELQMSLLHGGR